MEPRHGKARRRKETRQGRRLLSALVVAVTAGSLTAVATPVSAATKWLQVSAGSGYTCGVTGSHDLWCWGDNYYGQLGTGDTTNRLAPARIGAEGIWASVSAGYLHTCALDRNGTRYCWGSNHVGQLGYGDTTARLTPTAADSTWTTISVGLNHTCGIQTNHTAYCWGSDQFGQLGNSSTRNDGQPSPQQVAFDGQWSAISARDLATCGLDGDGTRYCWGNNIAGSLGQGEGAPYVTIPTTVSGDGTWRSVERGLYDSGCGVNTGKRLYCWGKNDYGQLGVGDQDYRSEPTQVSGKKWAQVSVGTYHTCGLKTNGAGYCWGNNAEGQLGVGTPLISTATTPKKIGGRWGNVPGFPKKKPMIWSSLSAGGGHTCGITTNGTLFCWGRGNYGQLGNGTTTNSFFPRKVA